MGARILVVDDSRTVRRIVEGVLSQAGYEVALAEDGLEGVESARKRTPDLVLVDYVMPKMNGLEFCEALRAVANLRALPVVLMSAKADRIGEEFMRRVGAVDAITKPFPPEALLAVTANGLARSRDSTRAIVKLPSHADRTSRPSLPPAFGDEDELDQIVSDTLNGAPSPVLRSDGEITSPTDLDDVAAISEAAQRGAEKIARAIAPALASISLDAGLAKKLESSLVSKLGIDALFTLFRDLAAIAPYSDGSLEGRLDHVPLGEILQMLQLQAQTGVLELRHGARVVSIVLRQGHVDMALGEGSDRELLLGRYLLEQELIDRDALEGLLRGGKGERRLLGDQLVKLGYITEEELRDALIRQTSEYLYQVLRWKNGRFRFVRGATRPEAASAELSLPISAILMEGVRRVDEWRLIEEKIQSFDEVLEPALDAIAGMGEDTLSREERIVLDAVDGRRTIREVVEVTRMASFDACKILFQLLTTRLVRSQAERD